MLKSTRTSEQGIAAFNVYQRTEGTKNSKIS